MNTSRGNVLFLILIAILFFAALSFAVSKSNNSGGSNTSKDKAKANAATFLQHAAAIRQGIQRIKLMNGCTDITLDFTTPNYTTHNGVVTNSANTNAPSNYKCHVFRPEGGGIAPTRLPLSAFDASHPQQTNPSGYPWVQNLGVTGFRIQQIKGIGTDAAAGTESANDIVGGSNYVNKDTCIEINNLAKVTNPNGAPPEDVITGTVGTYTNGSLTADGIRSIAGESGLYELCVHSGTAPNDLYAFMFVAVAR